jgi:hypothetical protein
VWSLYVHQLHFLVAIVTYNQFPVLLYAKKARDAMFIFIVITLRGLAVMGLPEDLMGETVGVEVSEEREDVAGDDD